MLNPLPEILSQKPFAPPYEKGRFVLHYYPESTAELERDLLIGEREAALQNLERFFERPLAGPIHLLAYPTQDDAHPYPVGTMTPEHRLVHFAWKAGRWDYEHHNPGHELTHLFVSAHPQTRSRRWSNPLLNEGLAEYHGGGPVDLHLRLTDGLQIRMPRHRVWIEGSHCWESRDLYRIAGSFMKFVLEDVPDGKRKVFELLELTWRDGRDDVPYFPDFLAKLESVFETSYAALMEHWNEVLEPYWDQHYQLEPPDREELEALVGEVRRARYLGFFTNLAIKVEDVSGKWHLADADPEGWKIC